MAHISCSLVTGLMATDSRLNNSESHNLQILWTICHNSSKQRILWSFNIFEISKYILYNTVKVLKKKKIWHNSESDFFKFLNKFSLWQMSSQTISHVYIIWTSNQARKCAWPTFLTFWPLSFQLGNGQWAFSETLESWHLQSHDVARLFLIQGPILWVSCHHSE